MNEIFEKVHTEIDDKLADVFSLCKKFGRDVEEKDKKYFAADVIASRYQGKFLNGLACACQCFFDSRMLHLNRDRLSPDAVLLGDLFIGQMSQFELPADSYKILELFSEFVAEETTQMNNGEEVTPDLSRYEDLFIKVAEGMDE